MIIENIAKKLRYVKDVLNVSIKRRIEIIKNEAKGISLMRFLVSAFLFSPVLIILIIIRFYHHNAGQDKAIFWISVILLLINIAFFFFLILIKKGEFKAETFTAYFTLMIFNVGIFPLFNYIKEYQERNQIDISYSVGFRSWGAKVEYYDIKISYYDKFGNPYSIPPSIVNDSNNWIRPLWTDENKINNFELGGAVRFKKKNDTLSIIITNCGAIIKPKALNLKASNFCVDAKLRLIQTDSIYKNAKKTEKYQSSQICLKVPVEIDSTKNINDIYYAFEFPYSNFSWSKLRIPGFNFDYTDTQLEHQSKSVDQKTYANKIIEGILTTIVHQNQNDSIEEIKELSLIHISAVLLDENAAYYIIKNKSTHSLPLFNFNISKYGALNLMEK